MSDELRNQIGLHACKCKKCTRYNAKCTRIRELNGAGEFQPPAPKRPRAEKNLQLVWIWAGVLAWNYWYQSPFGWRCIVKQIPCHVNTLMKNGIPAVLANCWPGRLIIDLVPREAVFAITNPPTFTFVQSRDVQLILPKSLDATELAQLINIDSGTDVGFVRFYNSKCQGCCPKVMILVYDSQKGFCVGVIPNDQIECFARLTAWIDSRLTYGNYNIAAYVQQAQQHLPPPPPPTPAPVTHTIDLQPSDLEKQSIALQFVDIHGVHIATVNVPLPAPAIPNVVAGNGNQNNINNNNDAGVEVQGEQISSSGMQEQEGVQK